MGINTRGQKLSVNNESFDIYFELLKTLDLLPTPKEEREYWYQRGQRTLLFVVIVSDFEFMLLSCSRCI
jgi:hypothetical protein